MKSNIHSKITCVLLLLALLTSCGGTTVETTAENTQPDTAETEAAEDFEAKLSYIEDLLGTGALTMNDLAETIKSQQYEITQLRKENNLYKSKLLKAVQQGFKI